MGTGRGAPHLGSPAQGGLHWGLLVGLRAGPHHAISRPPSSEHVPEREFGVRRVNRKNSPVPYADSPRHAIHAPWTP